MNKHALARICGRRNNVGRLYLLPLLNEFLEHHPGVSVEVYLSDEVVDLISSRADVAIRSGPLKNSNLVARRLGETRTLIVASPAYLEAHGTPQVPSELAAHNCLGFTFSQPSMEWGLKEKNGEAISVPVAGNARVSDGNGVRDLALLGLGLARVGFCQVEQDLAAGRLDGFCGVGLKPWDVAAGSLLVLEAGGLISDFDGEQGWLKSGDVLAGSPKIFTQMMSSLQPKPAA